MVATGPIPGRTRDTIEAQLDIDGTLFKIYDTAGLREAREKIEKKGMDLAEDRIRESDIVLFLLERE